MNFEGKAGRNVHASELRRGQEVYIRVGEEESGMGIVDEVTDGGMAVWIFSRGPHSAGCQPTTVRSNSPSWSPNRIRCAYDSDRRPAVSSKRFLTSVGTATSRTDRPSAPRRSPASPLGVTIAWSLQACHPALRGA